MKEIDLKVCNPNVRKKRRVKHPEFEKGLLKFVLERESDGLSEDLVLEKADRLGVSHDIEDQGLKLSKGWLQSFNKRNNIKSRALIGERGGLCIEYVQALRSDL